MAVLNPFQSRKLRHSSTPVCLEPLEERLLLSAAPTIEMGGEGGVGFIYAGQSLQIQFTAQDTDSPSAAVRLYYDLDTNPDNGKTLITDALTVSANQQTYTWTGAGQTRPGLYYLYGEVSDGETTANDYYQGSYIRVAPANPIATFDTSKGRFIVYLAQHDTQGQWISPYTVANFINYATTGYYDGLIFHRVIEDFMIQGGGFLPDLTAREPGQAIMNENLLRGGNYLTNDSGVLAMARGDDPNSATSQFFINTPAAGDPDGNEFLNYQDQDNPGYAAFGYVINGMPVVHEIEGVETHTEGSFEDVPVETVLINSVTVDFPDLNLHFGQLEGLLPTIVYTDDDGTIVTATIKGGYGLMNFNGDNLAVSVVRGKYIVSGTVESAELILGGTYSKTSVTLATSGSDGKTELMRILGETPVGKFTGKGVDIIGEGVLMTQTGCIGSLTLNALRDGADLLMEGSQLVAGVTLQAAVNINTLGDGTEVNLAGPMKSFRAASCAADSISAPWIKGLLVTGNFSSNLTLAGATGMYTLGSAKIVGNVSNSEWRIDGMVKSIQMVAGVSGWTLRGDGAKLDSVRSLKLGDVSNSSTLTVDGPITGLTAQRWAGGAITADSLKGLKITGNSRASISGDFTPSLTLHGDDAIFYTLGGAKIAGGVGAGQWKIAGNCGGIQIAKAVNGWSLRGTDTDALASVKGLKLVDVTEASLEVAGLLKAVGAIRWQAGSVSAGSAGSIKIAGNPRASVPGDFGATLTLSGSGVLAGAYTLGGLFVRDSLGGAVNIAGSAKSIKLGTMEANVAITGNVRSAYIVGTVLSLSPPSGPAIQWSVGPGSSTINGGGSVFKTTVATTLYATSSHGYNFADLIPYDELAAWWGYSSSFSGTLGNRSGNLEAVIADQTVGKTIDGANVDTYQVTSSFEGDTRDIQNWYYDTQAHLAVWYYYSPMGEVEFTFQEGLDFPAEMVLNQLDTTTSRTTAGCALAVPDGTGGWVEVPGIMTDGSSTASTHWLGHEQVVVNGNTYLAAKFEFDLLVSGGVTLFNGFAGTYEVQRAQTLWSVPGIGVVQGEITTIDTLTVPGEFTNATTDTGSYSLIAYSG